MLRLTRTLLGCALVALGASARPAAPPAPHAAEDGLASLAPIIGSQQSDLVVDEDTLLDIAFRHRLGFERVTRLNPGVDPWIPEPGTVILLPTEHILPDVPHVGLVVNVPELQLYDFTVDPDAPEVFALAIGDEMDPSLVGEYKVGNKRVQPVWNVPESIRLEKPELPAQVPPGPDNPLGPYWMTIGTTSYGIHGTNNRWSIGREATHGCLRLYNDQVERLFLRTPEGTPLRLVYQPVKLGRRGDRLYVEAHPDRYNRAPDRVAAALARLEALGVTDPRVRVRVIDVIDKARGEPVAVGVLPPDGLPRPAPEPGAGVAATSKPTS
jgi:L,D-transpeptidase ErfK/SrfK